MKITYVIKIVEYDNHWVLDTQQRTILVGYAKQFDTYSQAETYLNDCPKNHYYQIEKIFIHENK